MKFLATLLSLLIGVSLLSAADENLHRHRDLITPDGVHHESEQVARADGLLTLQRGAATGV